MHTTGHGGLDVYTEKSRRFSKLPPAPKDSPNAVKLGSKFTKIEIPDKEAEEEVKINQAVEEELKDEFSESVEIMDDEISDQNQNDVDGSEVVGDTLNVHVEKSRRFRYTKALKKSCFASIGADISNFFENFEKF